MSNKIRVLDCKIGTEEYCSKKRSPAGWISARMDRSPVGIGRKHPVTRRRASFKLKVLNRRSSKISFFHRSRETTFSCKALIKTKQKDRLNAWSALTLTLKQPRIFLQRSLIYLNKVWLEKLSLNNFE